jgi:uncharacterized protein (DUF488 family)
MPRSKRHPHFGHGPLGVALHAAGVAYDWRGRALGGLRRGANEARHPGLAVPAFRAYAEHMESEAFVDAGRALAESAAGERICMMCAERDPAQCHRSLIADWLVANGHRVIHLIEPGKSREHVLHASALVVDGAVRYARGDAQGQLF